MSLDIKTLNKKARRADDWRGIAFALFVGGGFLSAAGIAEHIRDGLAMMPVAFLCILWLNMRLAFSKHRHATDMLAVAREIADFDDEEEDLEEIFPGGGVTVWTFTNKTGHEIKAGTPVYITPPAPKMKPPKCECVIEEYTVYPHGWDGSCPKCGRKVRVAEPGLHMQVCGRYHRCPDGRSSLLEVGSRYCPRCGKKMPVVVAV